MQLVNIPLVLALPSWMRWKEFFFLVYLQVGRFISDNYKFSLDNEPQTLQTAKNLHKNTTKLKNNSSSTGNSAVDKFKDYRNSPKFPYVLRLVDYEGRCIICLKFIKSTVFKGENENYCEGCDLSQAEPISWQIKPADLIVCIDWRGSDRYRRDYISNTKSATSRIAELQKM